MYRIDQHGLFYRFRIVRPVARRREDYVGRAATMSPEKFLFENERTVYTSPFAYKNLDEAVRAAQAWERLNG